MKLIVIAVFMEAKRLERDPELDILNLEAACVVGYQLSFNHCVYSVGAAAHRFARECVR